MPSDTTHWLGKSPGPCQDAECKGRGLYTLGSGEGGAGSPRQQCRLSKPHWQGFPGPLPLVKTPLSPRSSSLALQKSAAKSFRALKTQECRKHPLKASKATHPLSASFSGRATSSLETNEKPGPLRKERGDSREQ